MKVTKAKRYPVYKCEKCGCNINKDMKIYHYYKSLRGRTPYKEFDLCENCMNKLNEWLEEKELLDRRCIISRFSVYTDN